LQTDDRFDTALAHVLEMEGGWSEDPHDPGGPTNRGITLATHAAYRGIAVDAGNFSRLRDELKAIDDATVREIYRQHYWHPCRAEALPDGLALMHFDTAVNHGVGTAARILQEAVGAAVDGEIGPMTIAAARARDPAIAVRAYAEARRRRYRALPHFWRFGRGWLARVDKTLARALALATPTSPTSPNRKDPTMTDKPVEAAPKHAAEAKWWGESMTIWGAALTALSTVLPLLGPLVGLDLTAEMVRQLGDQVVHVVQAIGGLVGTALTIWGRARATTRIERRDVSVRL
jgi:lysozyme family protein